MHGRAGSEIKKAHVSRNVYVKKHFYVKKMYNAITMTEESRITQINMMYVCLPGAQEKGKLRWWVDSDL